MHVEDHPLEYGTFSGTIPKGEYGAGTVSIWDRGRYDCEKWRQREVMVVLHGKRAKGRYVLFPTHGKNWMIHRMDPAPKDSSHSRPGCEPMLATPGQLPADDGDWAYEFKWDGMRVLIWIDGGRARAMSRNGNDVTGSLSRAARRSARRWARTRRSWTARLVVLGDRRASPSFAQLQHRMHASSPASVTKGGGIQPGQSGDLRPAAPGRPLAGRTGPTTSGAALWRTSSIAAPGWAVTPSFTSDAGSQVFRTAVDLGMEGVVAKRRTSTYQPGRRSRTGSRSSTNARQEVVIGGFTAGNGSRRGEFGAAPARHSVGRTPQG